MPYERVAFNEITKRAVTEKDKRSEQHISMRKLEGMVINTRSLGAPQLLRLVEILVDAFAEAREKRFNG